MRKNRASPPEPSEPEDFWVRLTNVGEEDKCWEWQGFNYRGYGLLFYKGEKWQAARLAYTLKIGPIPEGYRLAHTCENRRCCNPRHMLPCKYPIREAWIRRGSKLQEEKVKKYGRYVRRAERNAHIRALHAEGKSRGEIGRMLGLTTSGVSLILSGKREVLIRDLTNLQNSL